MMLFLVLANSPTDDFPPSNDWTTRQVIDHTKVESAIVSMRGDTIRCGRFETEYVDISYLDKKDGRVVKVTKKCPRTTYRQLSADLSLEEVVVFDRRGARIDSATLPTLLEDSVTALIVPVTKEDAETLKSLKVDAEILKSLKEERLILVVPASKLRDRKR
jgi:hypothetical protein